MGRHQRRRSWHQSLGGILQGQDFFLLSALHRALLGRASRARGRSSRTSCPSCRARPRAGRRPRRHGSQQPVLPRSFQLQKGSGRLSFKLGTLLGWCTLKELGTLLMYLPPQKLGTLL